MYPIREDRDGIPPSGFDTLGLHGALASTVTALGYAEPTPIQQQAIPHVLDCRDVLACAQTGTGKTAAFALPILDELLCLTPHERGRPIRALVLAPTRELASQIAESFRRYSPTPGIRCHVVFGGVGKRPQIDALRRGVDVLVATPGRLIDLMGDGVVDLSQVEMFVLDEADRMLDMGFIRDVRRITGRLPGKRQTLLFSATMPPAIRALAGELLHEPVELAVDPVASTVAPVSQSVYFVDGAQKMPMLLSILGRAGGDQALVFTRTKHRADRVARGLVGAGIQAVAIHGNKSQPARERALEEFKRGRVRVVVATDIAARGIDIKDLPTVINFDLPNEPEVYVHRVGRTGRAGASGTALSLCSPDERGHLVSIERLTRRRLEPLALPEGLASVRPHAQRRSHGTPRRWGGSRAGRRSGSARRAETGR